MTIIENLRLAHAVISGIPDSAVDLKFFRSECGTIACMAGHLCAHPHFAEFMVLKLDGSSWQLSSRLPDGGLVPLYSYEAMGAPDAHLGKNAIERLFSRRDFGEFDYEHPSWCDAVGAGVTDKELALWRIERQIEEVTNKEPS
jgi:hypothetical protein